MSDAIVVGGGPAGAITAALLAEARRDVMLIERQAGPHHKVCGDFLSTEACTALARLGISLLALGAVPITAIRLVHGKQITRVPLQFRGMGLTRRALDEALLAHAAATGATILRGHAVRALDYQTGACLRLETTAGPMSATAVFLAAGKHELRGARRRTASSPLTGLKTYFSLAPSQTNELRQHVELVLFSGGYAGLQLVEGDAAVLCLLVSRQALADAGGKFDHLLNELQARCPHLASRLECARPLLPRPIAVSGLPYGFLHAPLPGDPPLLFRVGDQACVIPSLTGDGVALALHSAGLAAKIWLAGGLSAAHHTKLRHQIVAQMRHARLLHHACLAPTLQPLAPAFARFFPGLVRFAATATRISPRFLPSFGT